ncbi:hypothetical protein [Bacillus tropicus]|uniref:hypothetical protein n=1 Tax=Bacillus tropicus TaxID=2026188 RepID=UPI003814E2F0
MNIDDITFSYAASTSVAFPVLFSPISLSLEDRVFSDVVVSLKNKIKEQHLNGSEPLENDNNLHSISYETFAERCEPVKGTISVSLKEIFSFKTVANSSSKVSSNTLYICSDTKIGCREDFLHNLRKHFS